MSSIFTRIINREIPGQIVAEEEKYVAFLDINPLMIGHTLVVPKREVDYIFDLDDDAIAGINLFAKRVALAIKSVIPCNRIAIAVIGLEVPHAHIHLVPINTMSDINFANPKLHPSKEELEMVAEKIRLAFQDTVR